MSKMPTAIALGFFDGVHIAHRKIIESAVDYAKKENLLPVALTFDRSPLELLTQKNISYITTNDSKRELIESSGAEAAFLPLSHTLLSMEPDEFAKKILAEEYNAQCVFCGYNYRFGKGGKGDTEILEAMGKQYGFTVKVLEEETLNGEIISSSHIRELLSSGNITLANKLLGRSYFITGDVCEGKKLGRTIGFPTANVFPPDKTVRLKNGVYKTRVTVDGMVYPAITNVGVNPTVGGEKLRTETYIEGFDRNIYDNKIKIEFLSFIRDERKFESIEDLKNQIRNDIARGEKL